MKSLAELQAIREKTLNKISMRKDADEGTRIVIGMATCGIAAGMTWQQFFLASALNSASI